MRTASTTTTYQLKKTGIRWGRVILAAVLSELCVITAILAAVGVYALFVAGGASAADLGERLGYYVAPPAGIVATLLLTFWVTRKLESQFITHGVLIGVVSVLLTVGFLLGARPEDRPMYLVAFALRIVGGYFGGWFAQWKRGQS